MLWEYDKDHGIIRVGETFFGSNGTRFRAIRGLKPINVDVHDSAEITVKGPGKAWPETVMKILGDWILLKTLGVAYHKNGAMVIFKDNNNSMQKESVLKKIHPYPYAVVIVRRDDPELYEYMYAIDSSGRRRKYLVKNCTEVLEYGRIRDGKAEEMIKRFKELTGKIPTSVVLARDSRASYTEDFGDISVFYGNVEVGYSLEKGVLSVFDWEIPTNLVKSGRVSLNLDAQPETLQIGNLVIYYDAGVPVNFQLMDPYGDVAFEGSSMKKYEDFLKVLNALKTARFVKGMPRHATYMSTRKYIIVIQIDDGPEVSVKVPYGYVIVGNFTEGDSQDMAMEELKREMTKKYDYSELMTVWENRGYKIIQVFPKGGDVLLQERKTGYYYVWEREVERLHVIGEAVDEYDALAKFVEKRHTRIVNADVLSITFTYTDDTYYGSTFNFVRYYPRTPENERKVRAIINDFKKFLEPTYVITTKYGSVIKLPKMYRDEADKIAEIVETVYPVSFVELSFDGSPRSYDTYMTDTISSILEDKLRKFSRDPYPVFLAMIEFLEKKYNVTVLRLRECGGFVFEM